MLWMVWAMGCTGAPTPPEVPETLPLIVDLPAIDLGRVDSSCRASQTVTVTNPNDHPVHFDGVVANGDDVFSVDGLEDQRVNPGESRTFTVRMRPLATGTYTAELSLLWSTILVDPDGGSFEELVATSTTLTVEGEVVDEPRWAQAFVQPEPRPADLLFVYDDPEAMETWMTNRVVPEVGQLFTALDERGGDYQVGVLLARTGSTAGVFRGPMITPTTADPATRLGEQLLDAAWFGTSALPLFASVEEALSPAVLSGPPNQGFNRLDAMLTVVFVADRDTFFEDVSPESFRTFLRNQRPEATDLRVHLLGPGDSCSTWDSSAESLEELAASTFGQHETLCDVDSTFFRQVAESALGLDGGYPLDAQPLGTTCDEVRVEVGGAFIPCTAWVVEDQRLFVQSPWIPAPGASVTADYRVEGACDLYEDPMTR